MKLNPDCIRDILLFLETQPFFKSEGFGSVESIPVFLEDIKFALPDYSTEELFYTLRVLGDGDYLDITVRKLGDNLLDCCVGFMTYQGHELLDKIKDDARWIAVKRGLHSVRSFSLAAIEAFANGAMSAAITATISGQSEIR